MYLLHGFYRHCNLNLHSNVLYTHLNKDDSQIRDKKKHKAFSAEMAIHNVSFYVALKKTMQIKMGQCFYIFQYITPALIWSPFLKLLSISWLIHGRTLIAVC